MSSRFRSKDFHSTPLWVKHHRSLNAVTDQYGNWAATAFDSVFQPRSMEIVSLALLNNWFIVYNVFRPVNQIPPAFLFSFSGSL